MKRALLLFVALISLAAPAAAVQEAVVSAEGKHQIAHTRLAPVVVHRALPPFKGQHTYQGRRR